MKKNIYITIIIFISLYFMPIEAQNKFKNGQQIKLKGSATNLMIGAVLIAEDSTFYYIDGLSYWPIKSGTNIIVTGNLDMRIIKKQKRKDGDTYLQTIGDPDKEFILYYITDAKWTIDTSRKSIDPDI